MPSTLAFRITKCWPNSLCVRFPCFMKISQLPLPHPKKLKAFRFRNEAHCASCDVRINYLLMVCSISRVNDAGLCSLCIKRLVSLPCLVHQIAGLCGLLDLSLYRPSFWVHIVLLSKAFSYTWRLILGHNVWIILCSLISLICCREASAVRPRYRNLIPRSRRQCDDWQRLQALYFQLEST
jgi:hypothetical protein